ncbi:rod shape-determining protein MreD [Alteribacillus sp. HJP-4]|uniref:rod shape-determining protein MreD n=1 Tax=Alteribacillus sp. HJP-4 TaxID=2775394 RepID=UPI0035CD29BF
MIRFILPALLFLLFIIESTWFQIFFPPSSGDAYVLVPRFTLIIVVLAGIYRGPFQAVLLGVAVGALYDFVFIDIIGIYMFSFGFTAYISSFTMYSIRESYGWQMLILIGAIFIFEWMTYGFYYVIGYTDIIFEEFFVTRLLPSLILNGLAAMLFLIPVKKMILQMDSYEDLKQR